jgi:hypothetical protein
METLTGLAKVVSNTVDSALNDATQGIRLAIENASDGFYLIDDKTYYLRIDDAGGAKPIVREINSRKELLLPVRNKLTYSIHF